MNIDSKIEAEKKEPASKTEEQTNSISNMEKQKHRRTAIAQESNTNNNIMS